MLLSAVNSGHSRAIPDQTVDTMCHVQADAFMLAHPQTTLGAIHFNVTDSQVCLLLLQLNESASMMLVDDKCEETCMMYLMSSSIRS